MGRRDVRAFARVESGTAAVRSRTGWLFDALIGHTTSRDLLIDAMVKIVEVCVSCCELIQWLRDLWGDPASALLSGRQRLLKFGGRSTVQVAQSIDLGNRSEGEQKRARIEMKERRSGRQWKSCTCRGADSIVHSHQVRHRQAARVRFRRLRCSLPAFIFLQHLQNTLALETLSPTSSSGRIVDSAHNATGT